LGRNGGERKLVLSSIKESVGVGAGCTRIAEVRVRGGRVGRVEKASQKQ